MVFFEALWIGIWWTRGIPLPKGRHQDFWEARVTHAYRFACAIKSDTYIFCRIGLRNIERPSIQSLRLHNPYTLSLDQVLATFLMPSRPLSRDILTEVDVMV